MDLVTVAVPAASTGTFTNEKGEFKLKIASSDTVEVVFSYLGYRRETRKLVDPAEKVSLTVRMYNKDRTLRYGSIVVKCRHCKKSIRKIGN